MNNKAPIDIIKDYFVGKILVETEFSDTVYLKRIVKAEIQRDENDNKDVGVYLTLENEERVFLYKNESAVLRDNI